MGSRRGSMKTWLAHAFAVDPPGPAEPTPEQQDVVDTICRAVARRGLGTVGAFLLEMSRPLNFVASQTMHFASPGVWALASDRTYKSYRGLADFLERRGSLEYLADRIEHFDRDGEQAPADDQPTTRLATETATNGDTQMADDTPAAAGPPAEESSDA